MARSGLSGRGFPEKKKENYMKKDAENFVVKGIPQYVRLTDFDQVVQSDLQALTILSERQKITREDIEAIQLIS